MESRCESPGGKVRDQASLPSPRGISVNMEISEIKEKTALILKGRFS